MKHRRRGHSEQDGPAGVSPDKAEASPETPEEPPRSLRRYIFGSYHLKVLAKYCPLSAAVLAPLSTLLDIPALTQHWYSLDGAPQKDPKASLALSAVGLVLNVFANALLILRFSSSQAWWWRHATQWSLICWILKVVVAMVNLIVFGILTRNTPGYSYDQGFWCAVVSIIDAGIITVALIFHYIFAFGRSNEDTTEVRAEGRRFMMSVTVFLGILGLQALAFCKIEHWAYSDSIYFSVQTALTIGYGDFTPSTAAGKVLVFPFSVLTISQLGNEIALIIGFISARADERRDRWRKRYEKAMHDMADRKRPQAGLLEEMALIHYINSREEIMTQVYDLLWSVLSLVTFWVVGAAIFSKIEGWPYGDGIYSVMILSLTIGFGDYTPTQPASRVVFIVYALMAVPIVTSFAVQTITGLLSTVSDRRAAREAFEEQKRQQPESFASHSDFVLHHHQSYDDYRTRLYGKSGPEKPPEQPEEADGTDGIHSTQGKEGRARPRSQSRGEDDRDTSDADGTTAADPEEQEEAENEGLQMTSSHADQMDKDVDAVDQVLQKKQEANVHSHQHAEKTGKEDNGEEKEEVREEEAEVRLELLRQLMDCIVKLEAEARQMMLDTMGHNVARTLLLADRNVQARDVRALRGDDANMIAIWRGEEEKTERDRVKRQDAQNKDSTDQSPGQVEKAVEGNSTDQGAMAEGDMDMLSRVRRYRETFAEVLVLGSILRKLEGEEQNRFERWREENNDVGKSGEERWEQVHDVSKTINLGSLTLDLVDYPRKLWRANSHKGARRAQ